MRVLIWYLLAASSAAGAMCTLFAGCLHVWAYHRFGDRAGFRFWHVVTAVGFSALLSAVVWLLLELPVRQITVRPSVWLFIVGTILAAVGAIGLTQEAIRVYVDKEFEAKEET